MSLKPFLFCKRRSLVGLPWRGFVFGSFLLSSLLFSGRCFAESESLTAVNFQWYLDNHQQIVETIQGGQSAEVIPIVNTLGSIWQHKDGAVWVEVAPAIAQALMHQNELMLTWFIAHPKAWQEWQSNMTNALFTNWDGSDQQTQQLEALRQTMLDKLAKLTKSPTSEQQSAMNQTLHALISASSVRVID